MAISLIVAAGGMGTRFDSGADKTETAPAQSKLFYSLQDKPILVHTLARFQNIPAITEVLVAVPQTSLPTVKRWSRTYQLKGIRWIKGGKTRAESVWNALRQLKQKNEWVMVHDGARPLVTPDDIKTLCREAARNGADGLVLARRVVPTLKKVAAESREIEHTVDRRDLYEAETPQLVRKKSLAAAYERHPDAFAATDEASLLEYMKAKVRVVTHTNWNPKITAYQDLKLAEAYLNGAAPALQRTGLGFDCHRLVPKRPLYLGGVKIPFSKGALGHSDGDALLHAITDALLGATGQGDIGEHFSDRKKKYKNIRSTKILESIMLKTRKLGWQVVNVDSNVILEKPRLGPRKRAIRRQIAKLLGIAEENVSVKAKTAEGLGAEGQGLAVRCEAIVTVRKVA